MSTAIEKIPPQSEAAITPTPMTMLQLAVEQGADIEKLSKLMDLQQRWEASEARRAFERDFAAFKSERVRIIRNVEITDGPLKGKQYADLFSVVDALTPALAKHRFGASWRLTKDEPGWMEVTCTLKHELGHCTESSMGGPPDTGGAKNAIQARASSKTYLERYTLLAVTGMAASGTDTDGQAGTSLPEHEVVEKLEWIRSANDLKELQRIFTAAGKAAQDAGDKKALAAYIKAKDERKEALRASA